MDKPLFAIKEDLDMLAEKVQYLYVGFTKLDWIAQKIKKLEEELTCQGEQMRRIEKWMYGTDEKIQSMDDRIQSMDDRIQSMDDKIQNLDARMQGMEKLLILICKKLKIKISA